jgi:hypothetical protein
VEGIISRLQQTEEEYQGRCKIKETFTQIATKEKIAGNSGSFL